MNVLCESNAIEESLTGSFQSSSPLGRSVCTLMCDRSRVRFYKVGDSREEDSFVGGSDDMEQRDTVHAGAESVFICGWDSSSLSPASTILCMNRVPSLVQGLVDFVLLLMSDLRVVILHVSMKDEAVVIYNEPLLNSSSVNTQTSSSSSSESGTMTASVSAPPTPIPTSSIPQDDKRGSNKSLTSKPLLSLYPFTQKNNFSKSITLW